MSMDDLRTGDDAFRIPNGVAEAAAAMFRDPVGFYEAIT